MSDVFERYYSSVSAQDFGKLHFYNLIGLFPTHTFTINISIFPQDTLSIRDNILNKLRELGYDLLLVEQNFKCLRDKIGSKILPVDSYSMESYHIDMDMSLGLFLDYSDPSSFIEDEDQKDALQTFEISIYADSLEVLQDVSEAILEIKRFYIKESDPEKSLVQMLLFDSQGNYHSHDVAIESELDIDIQMNYGKEFLEKDSYIKKSLATSHKGIILLHGLPGSGKSTYIKHLISTVKKEFVILNLREASKIDTPEFTYWLINNQGKVLIIEEAEQLILSREEEANTSLAGILNLSDGITGSAFRNPIIMTFNTKKENIDKALLRKGRLICEHEFKELSLEETNLLLRYLSYEYISEKPMVLTDIYNLEDKAYDIKKGNTIGF
jgi:hypothetical protein